MKLKHSIGQLALAVLACGVAVRAICSPTPLWAAVILSSALAVCTLALVGALYARGPGRASFGGVASCGWIYLLVSLGPWFSEQVGPHLATGAAIDLLFDEMGRSDPSLEMLNLQVALQNLAAKMQEISKSASDQRNNPELMRIKGEWERIESNFAQLKELRARDEVGAAADPVRRWAIWARPSRLRHPVGLVSAPKDFQRIGHGLFAIAFALAGGAFGRFIAGGGAADVVRPADPTTA